MPTLDQRKYKVNDNYFLNIDNEHKAYWLGYLYADGCISKLNSSSVGYLGFCSGSAIFLNSINCCMERKLRKLRKVSPNSFVLRYTGRKQLLWIYKYFYKRSTIFLKRKQQKFKKIIGV